MERLRLRDLRALLDFLRVCYAARDTDEFIAVTLSGISRIVPHEIASYDEINPHRRRSANWHNPPETTTPARDDIWERFMHEQPILSHYLQTGDGTATKVSDFIGTTRFHDLALYQELYRGMDAEHIMAMFVPTPPPLKAVVALHRQHRDFTERERLLLNIVRPHLAEIHQTAGILTQLRQQLVFLQKGLEELRCGLAVVGPHGRLVPLNPTAETQLSEYFGVRRQRGRLPDGLRAWIRHQECVLARSDDAPRVRQPLAVERDGKRVIVRLVTPASEHAPRLLLFEERRLRPEAATLVPLGLTRREAEILTWVAMGKTNPEIATILSISPRTVQTHLLRVYEKLGVETRTGAAARAFELQEFRCEARPRDAGIATATSGSATTA